MRNEVYMAEEVTEVVAEATTEAVESETTISQSDYEALKKELEALKGSFQAEVSKASKAEREKYEKQLAKSKMTAEEAIRAEQEEKMNEILSELNTLKTEKKQLVVTKLLTDNELPTFFQNDVRLVNATDDDLPNVVKLLKKEFSEVVKPTPKAVSGTAPKTTPTEASGTQSTLQSVLDSNPILKQYQNSIVRK